MTEKVRSNFQNHPYHLVSPSPWPFYTSVSLLTLTTSGALSMHSFSNGYIIFFLAFFVLISSMCL
jgi:cytochrome c oxidase subunit 3